MGFRRRVQFWDVDRKPDPKRPGPSPKLAGIDVFSGDKADHMLAAEADAHLQDKRSRAVPARRRETISISAPSRRAERIRQCRFTPSRFTPSWFTPSWFTPSWFTPSRRRCRSRPSSRPLSEQARPPTCSPAAWRRSRCAPSPTHHKGAAIRAVRRSCLPRP